MSVLRVLWMLLSTVFVAFATLTGVRSVTSNSVVKSPRVNTATLDRVGPDVSTASPARPVRPPVIVDSAMARSDALGSNNFPALFLNKMQVVDVPYLGFDGRHHQGQIVVERSIAKDVLQIFVELERVKYPITKVVPIVQYGWDDEASIKDNNTSGFNFRSIITPGGRIGRLSQHAFGRAIDLNPLLNPYVASDGSSPTPYDPKVPGTLTRRSAATKIFLAHGWQWGGDWKNGKDFQHFDKPGS